MDNFTHCKLCSKHFSGIESYKDHIVSEKHKKRVRQSQDCLLVSSSENTCSPGLGPVMPAHYHCEVCDKTFTGPDPHVAHMNGAPHAKKVKQLQERAVFSSPGNTCNLSSSIQSTSMSSPYYCAVCDKSLTGPAPYSAHMSGAPHAKKVANLKLQKEFLSRGSDTVDSGTSSVSVTPSKNVSELLLSSSITICSLCNVPLSGAKPAKEHYEGSSHKKKERQQMLYKQLVGKEDSPTNEDSESEDSENINADATEQSEENLKNELSDVIFLDVDQDPINVIKNLKWD